MTHGAKKKIMVRDTSIIGLLALAALKLLESKYPILSLAPLALIIPLLHYLCTAQKKNLRVFKAGKEKE